MIFLESIELIALIIGIIVLTIVPFVLAKFLNNKGESTKEKVNKKNKAISMVIMNWMIILPSVFIKYICSFIEFDSNNSVITKVFTIIRNHCIIGSIILALAFSIILYFSNNDEYAK